MHKRIFNSGVVVLVVGIILLILGNIWYTEFFYDVFRSSIFFSIGPILNILGILLFISGIVFVIIGAFMKEETTSLQTRQELSQNLKDQAIYCKNCGAKLSGDAIFCDKCGTKV